MTSCTMGSAISHKSVYVLLRAEHPSAAKSSVRAAGRSTISVNTLLCDTVGLVDSSFENKSPASLKSRKKVPKESLPCNLQGLSQL